MGQTEAGQQAGESGIVREVPADQAVEGAVDCSAEEIRLPGSIQRHGFFLMLDRDAERVIAASENVEEFLHVPLKLVLGTTLETLLEREALSAVRALACSTDPVGLVMYLGAFRVGEELCSIVTHCQDDRRILEFERLDRLVFPEIMNSVITNFVGKLSKIETTEELCQAITKQIKDLTGFDRVLLYSFDEVGHGTVLTEENDGPLPRYLDLRFPASDIPEQARLLYVLNTIRIIPNAIYTPSPLVGTRGVSVKGIDMSQSVLRSVSPVHLEYMRNMGTMSSMSISILCDGKLWGLISGHHATPRTVPYLVRSACDLLTKVVGTQLSAYRNAEKLKKMVHFHTVQRAMLTRMAAEKNYVAAMLAGIEDLVQVTDAGGAALVLEGEVHRAGETPAQEEVLRIAEWLDGQGPMEMMQTRSLGESLPWAEGLRPVASGMLAIRFSDVRRGYVLWFRPEVIRTVKWAGEPVKIEDASAHLHPRRSFAAWKQTVQGQSAMWSEMEMESAREFRGAVMAISLRRAEEAIEVSEARFQQLTHALPALVWTSNDSGELTYVNDRWKEMGFAPSGSWFGVVGLQAEDTERVQAAWQRSVGQGSLFEEEMRVTAPNQRERWHLVRAVPFRGAEGQRAGWVGTLTDMTDRREREAALRMTEKLATTGRMTSVIAHEINNPLESMTNLLFLLRGELDPTGPAHDYIALAESELERISGITRQTLRWGREMPEKREWTAADAIFEDVLRLFAGKIRNRHVQLTTEVEGEVLIYAMTGQIRQVVANLLSNAIDAVPVGGAVRMSARRTGSDVEIVVEDKGSGMSQDTLRQIFQPFYSTKGDLGNGLGLYISHEIVERHRGRLEVSSEVGQGTTMRAWIPQAQASSAKQDL